MVSKAGYGSFSEVSNMMATDVLSLYHYELFLVDYKQEVNIEIKRRKNT